MSSTVYYVLCAEHMALQLGWAIFNGVTSYLCVWRHQKRAPLSKDRSALWIKEVIVQVYCCSLSGTKSYRHIYEVVTLSWLSAFTRFHRLNGASLQPTCCVCSGILPLVKSNTRILNYYNACKVIEYKVSHVTCYITSELIRMVKVQVGCSRFLLSESHMVTVHKNTLAVCHLVVEPQLHTQSFSLHSSLLLIRPMKAKIMLYQG